MSTESAGIASPELGTIGPGTPRRKARYILALVVLAAAVAAYVVLQPRAASKPDASEEPVLPDGPTPAFRPAP